MQRLLIAISIEVFAALVICGLVDYLITQVVNSTPELQRWSNVALGAGIAFGVMLMILLTVKLAVWISQPTVSILYR